MDSVSPTIRAANYWFIASIFACYSWLSHAEADNRLSISQIETNPSKKVSTKQCELTFGWDLIKPYQYLDQSDQVVGLQIELVDTILKEMDCKLNLQQGEWSELIHLLKNGKIDFMADMTITPERLEFGNSSDVYRKETFSLYVRANDVDKHQGKSITSLVKQGFRLGLTEGYVYSNELELLRNIPQFEAQFSYQPSNINNYQRLIDGDIDGLLEDSLVAGFTMRNAQLSVQMKRLENEIYSGEIAFLFSKQSVEPETIIQFNRALSKIKKTSEYNKTWLKSVK